MVTNITDLSFEKASKTHGSAERVFEYIFEELAFPASPRGAPNGSNARSFGISKRFMCLCTTEYFQATREMTTICGLSFSEQPDLKGGKGNSKKRSKILSKAILSTVQHRDGSTTTLHSPVTGHVLEWNHRLVENPSLLLGTLEGYVAVIQPDDKTSKVISDQSQM